ncbi:MAG: IPT/TIG domain-containing protein, partial [Pseudomonadota bacterium]
LDLLDDGGPGVPTTGGGTNAAAAAPDLICAFGGARSAVAWAAPPGGVARATCRVPAGVGAVRGSALLAFELLDAAAPASPLDRGSYALSLLPTPQTVRPARLPLRGGGQVLVTGVGFASSEDAPLYCVFGARRTRAMVHSPTALACSVPPAETAAPSSKIVARGGSCEAGE